ncbi:MAG: prolyl oligopeptidase family serine peptidase [Vicinamibacterales bacterium]
MQQSPQQVKTVAPYGAWASPLTAARVTAGALRLGEIALDGGDVYWTEGRASEGGRYVIVRRTADGRISDVTPPGFNVRSRVHEYGGAAMTVHRGNVFFCNFADQRLYVQRGGGAPVPLTPEGFFYADARVDVARDRLVAVREDHRKGDAEPVAAIVAIPVARAEARALQQTATPRPTGAERPDVSPGVTSPGAVLVSGADFYSDPAVSPDGATLAWLQWNHPNMPWDGTELWTAHIRPDGTLGERTKVAGGPDESIFQPEWSPDGVLHFVSDRTGWWNLYRARPRDAGAEAPGLPAHAIEPLHPMSADFGKPQWTFPMVTYAFAGPRRIAATYTQNGRWHLAFIETESLRWEPVQTALDVMESIRADERAIYFVGGSPTTAAVVARMTLAAMEPEVLRRSTSEPIDAAWISTAEPVTFQSPHPSAPARTRPHPSAPASTGPHPSAPDRTREVHAFYYAPRNPDFQAPEGTRPPLLVLTHGGPTGATETALDPEVQFWTSRGFAVLDVNYSGSTGYGRAYRDRLKGQWGIVDVEDAVAGAMAMVEAGKADGERLAIRGGSAGGYTTLAALTFHSTFKAGASYYGISDIEVLARDTHKFESRYLDSLIGPYPAAKDVYVERSPIHFTDQLSSALILFQGLEDKVVPPNQSQMMADAVRKKGLPVAYLTYEGEQHGFRKAENIVRSLEAELYFYGKVFGFSPADAIEPVDIDNLR